MGLIQNKVTVSQPNSHVVVKNAGGLRGLTGETGPQGPQGVPGEAATVTAGTTTTLPAGSDATVQNVGSTSAAIFNFGIPKGDKGDTGESGAAATISVGSTSTLPAGSSATVTNSGTSSAAVFDFGIPKGDKGDTGATGADGYSPTATVTKTGDIATITITDKNGTTTASVSDGTTPTVNDGTLTIQKNGTTVQTFSADQASNVTANITVPTQFSELGGTVSSSQIEDEAITTGSVSGTGTNITLAGTMEGGAIESVEMYGDTEQTTYSGKNLFSSAIEQGGFDGNGAKTASSAYRTATPISIDPSTQYSLTSSGASAYDLYYYDSSMNYLGYGYTTGRFTTRNGAVFLNISTSGSVGTAPTEWQLELGSTSTSYEPYVGGTASPNPDYPQEVQTVTGEQTITVSNGQGESQEYEINLGDIELCKIGTYQDYIYKSGNDWYIHKEVRHLSLAVSDMDSSSDQYPGWSNISVFNNDIGAGTNGDLARVTSYVSNVTLPNSTSTTETRIAYNTRTPYEIIMMLKGNTTQTQWKSQYPNLTLELYYGILNTPTDTQITNSALIAQLEDLLSATTYAGTTYITVSGDLASPLEVVAESDSKLAPNSVYGAAIKDGAVSVDKIEDGAVTPAKISTSAYQSGETAVGTWIDGKTIYRQVLTGTVQITANNVATVTTTIAAKSIVSTSGWYQSWKQNDTTSNKVAFGHIMGDKVYSYALIRSDNYIELGFISSVNVNSQYEVVVEYTKKD